MWEKYIKKDLRSLYDADIINNAVILNKQLPMDCRFCANMEPMYFNGKIDAKTVMIMLNPGGEKKEYKFSKKDKYHYKNFEDYLNQYIFKHQEYGRLYRDNLGDFDTKQAVFLHDFKNTMIDIPNNFWEKNKEVKTIAKENVLMQKLQLELVPYHSRKFQGLFSSNKQAMKNYSIIKEHINRLFEIILLHEREYVLFCSRQFASIFNAINQLEQDLIRVTFGTIQKNSTIMKSNLQMCTVKIQYREKCINGAIIHSFAMQSLPKAYEKMRKYGKFCYDVINQS